jgi:hypothetical protein
MDQPIAIPKGSAACPSGGSRPKPAWAELSAQWRTSPDEQAKEARRIETGGLPLFSDSRKRST